MVDLLLCILLTKVLFLRKIFSKKKLLKRQKTARVFFFATGFRDEHTVRAKRTLLLFLLTVSFLITYKADASLRDADASSTDTSTDPATNECGTDDE